MNTKKRQRFVILITGVLALVLLASCSRQVTKPLETGDTGPAKAAKHVEENRTEGKTSAGVTISGNPELIEVFSKGNRMILKPGDKSFDKIAEICERIVLRVGASASEPPVSDASYIKMRAVAFRTVRLTYGKEPVFVILGTMNQIKQNKKLVGAKGLKQITFFVPISTELLKPETMFDGFYYGNIRMISTLTNKDLIDAVKGMQ